MRVTNEQIDAMRICDSQMSCSTCRYEKTLDDCDPTKEKIVADLLEARELIKEMRMFIDSIQLDGCMAEIKRAEILDRTKDYGDWRESLERRPK